MCYPMYGAVAIDVKCIERKPSVGECLACGACMDSEGAESLTPTDYSLMLEEEEETSSE